mgnify:FL=1
MYDAVFVIVEAFNKLFKKKPEVGESLKRGPLFNNGSRLDCYANYSNNTWVTPWEHGDKISKHLRKVKEEKKFYFRFLSPVSLSLSLTPLPEKF